MTVHNRDSCNELSTCQGSRELLLPNEVRMLDNRYAILFIRGERPVMDLKYDILKHPDVSMTTDGKMDPYVHGVPWDAGSSIELVYDPELIKDAADNAKLIELPETEYVLLSETDVEKLVAEEEKKRKQKVGIQDCFYFIQNRRQIITVWLKTFQLAVYKPA